MNRSLTVQEQKSLLREELREKRAELASAEKARRSLKILNRLFRHPRFQGAKSIFTYLALPSEVETWPLVEEGLRHGKRIYVPHVDSNEKRIWAIEVSGLTDLKPGTFGILEPEFDTKRVAQPEDLELAIIPGLGFDPEGGRLGRGEGYFDRFLKEAKEAYKIGLAFECQIVEKIPCGTNDVIMNEILVG